MTNADDVKKAVTMSIKSFGDTIESFEDILDDFQNNWYRERSEARTVKTKLKDTVTILQSLKLYLEGLTR